MLISFFARECDHKLMATQSLRCVVSLSFPLGVSLFQSVVLVVAVVMVVVVLLLLLFSVGVEIVAVDIIVSTYDQYTIHMIIHRSSI